MSTAKEQLIQELDQTPDFVVQEVLDFLLFIKVRLKHKIREDQTDSLQQPPSLPPFLQFVEEISTQIPKEERAKLASDLSKNIDHYCRTGPDQSEEDTRRIGKIKAVGSVWEQKLRHLVEIEQLGL